MSSVAIILYGSTLGSPSTKQPREANAGNVGGGASYDGIGVGIDIESVASTTRFGRVAGAGEGAVRLGYFAVGADHCVSAVAFSAVLEAKKCISRTEGSTLLGCHVVGSRGVLGKGSHAILVVGIASEFGKASYLALGQDGAGRERGSTGEQKGK